MLNISQFAEECNTTVKTIRHYDNIGLLKADYISEESGYRYYRRASVGKYKQIVSLKQAGFTLKEIKEKFFDYNFSENMANIEQQMLLLKHQQETCERIKKEYEKAMEEAKRVTVTQTNEQILITSKETQETVRLHANVKIADKCAALIDHSMNSEQFINIAFEDLKEMLDTKTATSFGKCYSPDCDITAFDNIDINSEDEKATALIVFFEASPDSSMEVIADAVESLMLAFSDKADVLFSANMEHTEKGLMINWICFK